jgi:hypothetical protein
MQAQSRGPGSLPVHRGVGRWRQLTIRVQSAARIKGKFSPSGAENIFLGAMRKKYLPPFLQPAPYFIISINNNTLRLRALIFLWDPLIIQTV